MPKPSRRLAALCAALVAVALLALRPSGEPGVTMRDFEAYYAAGATWLAPADPYGPAIWHAESQVPGVDIGRHEVLPFVGVPATLPLFGTLARLPYDAARTIWTAFLLLAVIALTLTCARLLRLDAMQTLLVALCAVSFVPITSDFVLGQAALPAFAFATLAIALPYIVAPLAIAFACLQPNVALGLLVLLTARRTAAAVFAAAVLVFFASAYASGIAWPWHYATTLAAHAGAERFSAIQYTVGAVFYGFSFPQTIATALAAATAFVVAAVVVRRIAAVNDVSHRFALACCAVPFVAGFFHEHDFVVLFFPALLAMRYSRTPAFATLAAVLVGVNWLDFAQQPQGATQDLVLAAALMTAAIALRPRRSQLWAVGASAVVLAAGAWIGSAHPLPIWPNDMAGAASGSTIAELWKNEQLQTGLLRPDAAAACLRTFALLGSTLLLVLNLNIDVHHVVERGNRIGVEVL